MEINLITQGDSGGKVNILEDYSINHYGRRKKKNSYEHVANSEWLPKGNCLNLQIQKQSEW
jgi:hypothetical protein